MKFKQCHIVVRSEADKKEFLRACQHIHDFSVMFDKNKKITAVQDEWSRGSKMKIRKINTKGKHPDCGICLNFDEYPFLNFLAGLWDCENTTLDRDRFFIVIDEPYSPIIPRKKKSK
jgi:hypothetical protein